MISIALTGHTRGLGLIIHHILVNRGHRVIGFSLSNGHDLRDYDQVRDMIHQVQGYNWFINCAKPDFAQTQILYRLLSAGFSGRILNVGSPIVHKETNWKDLGLLEYSTQKVALHHAHTVLDRLYPDQLVMWEPEHAQDDAYVGQFLQDLGL